MSKINFNKGLTGNLVQRTHKQGAKVFRHETTCVKWRICTCMHMGEYNLQGLFVADSHMAYDLLKIRQERRFL